MLQPIVCMEVNHPGELEDERSSFRLLVSFNLLTKRTDFTVRAEN